MSTSFPLEGMRVRFAGETDTGKKRSHNEDTLYIPESERVVIVADGMGGHAAGDIASQLAVQTVVDYLTTTAEEKEVTWPFMADRENRRHENRLVTAVKMANLNIFETSQRENKKGGMGTTLVAGLFCDEEILWAHVGDSRIYRVRDGQMSQLTEDHSLLNDYIRMKRITQDEVDDFPHKNVIVRALGMKESVTVDILQEAPVVGDIYLLCSDGLCDMLTDDEILPLTQGEDDLDRCCEVLVQAANDAGGVDNITVALARIETL
jgi:PPM family protein phosphatase